MTGDCLAGQPPASGIQVLCLLARLHQISAAPVHVAHQLALGSRSEVSTADLLLAAKHVGLKARLHTTSGQRLPLVPLPAIALIKANDGAMRYVLLAQCDGQRVLYQDPAENTARPCIEPLEVFQQKWTGELVLVTSRASLAGELARFDFSWFIPALVKYRKLLGEVLLISLALQLFALVSPLFFQVVMDKVLVHQGWTTLNVLVIGLVIVVCFESLLNGLRSYVFSHTTSRIDVELGARLFRHLVQLPLAYFQARRVGDSVARVRELENIRHFLTGNALTVALDLLFTIVFIAVMLLYSVPLTLVVLVSLPLYVGLSLAVVPVLRARLDQKFARGAENQAMLVETVTGIQTVKASALEPSLARRWDNLLAAYVGASFRTQNLAAWAHEGVNLIGKLVSAGTLWYGAHLVIRSELTVGQFVAFNMFAQRVAQPIMRMAQLWTDFQQTGISMARLGDILNTRAEVASSSAAQLPPLKGAVTLDQVVFRYRPEAPPVLKGVSLEVRPGEMVGIVGRSGSGKSTLTKLVQRLYVPESGRLLVDGIDISLIDAAQLRRQVGVVLQENLLFNRSVRENIAIADPAAPIEWVVKVAQLAGAHEFVSELPEGYDTIVGEQGSSLSGGQRQRIAIARALFTNPRILILDEATSALDYESEAIIQRNMHSICQGRTVFVIAHRLSAVRSAKRIIVMDKGEVREVGSHAQLLQNPQGIYARLWRMQGAAPEALEADGMSESAAPNAQALELPHPARELLRRYAAVFRAAWALRRELAGPRRLADEAAFLPAALSLQETPVHPAPRRAAYAIMGAFACALAWSIFGEVDIVAVAPGRIVVSERTKLVQPLERSVVRRVLVKDGDAVTEGQPLVELDPTNAVADMASIDEQFRAAESDALRARAIVDALDSGRGAPRLAVPAQWPARDAEGARVQMAAEWSDISAKLDKLGSEIARRRAETGTARELIAKLEATLPLAREREKDVARLVAEGFMASHAGQDRTRERIELERDLATQRARLAEAVAGLHESEAARAAYVAETRRALREREAQSDLKQLQLEQERAKAAAREQLTVLKAPASGTVQQLAVHTAGGIVTEAQMLMVVVPSEADVTAEVAIENKDVGFVKEGLQAAIKLETFPFTRYGTIAANVTRVSADAVPDEKRGALFPATLRLAQRVIDVDGRPVRLSPGMNVTAEIKTGRRQVIDFLLGPVEQMRAESLRER